MVWNITANLPFSVGPHNVLLVLLLINMDFWWSSSWCDTKYFGVTIKIVTIRSFFILFDHSKWWRRYKIFWTSLAYTIKLQARDGEEELNLPSKNPLSQWKASFWSQHKGAVVYQGGGSRSAVVVHPPSWLLLLGARLLKTLT